MMRAAENLQKKFLAGLARTFVNKLPKKETRNARRIRFFFMLAILIVYAWTRKIRLMPYSLHQTAEQQKELWRKGREGNPGKICTNSDGYDQKSRHQYWEATDLLIVKWNGKSFKSQWGPRKPYEILGEFWESIGGTWGDRWKEMGATKFDDYFHFQLKI